MPSWIIMRCWAVFADPGKRVGKVMDDSEHAVFVTFTSVVSLLRLLPAFLRYGQLAS